MMDVKSVYNELAQRGEWYEETVSIGEGIPPIEGEGDGFCAVKGEHPVTFSCPV